MRTITLVIFVLIALTLTKGQSCDKDKLCSAGNCCSKWGYCGNSEEHCGAGCQSGACRNKPNPATPRSSSRCGLNWAAANGNCGTPCTNNGNCRAGESCFKDLSMTPCGGTTPLPSTPSTGNSGGRGTIGSLISESRFNAALSACGVNKPGLYRHFVDGFTAPLDGGMAELALLLGNTDHESGAFQFTEEIRCKGVRQVTGDCPYGLYHGRGYIQLSWDYNYRAAANYLKNPRIFSDPDIVMNDPVVNMQTVQWFWVNSVQPTLRSKGYTMGASVRAINGGLECDSGPIAQGRVSAIQCFQRVLGIPVDFNTRCPARAVGDTVTQFSGENSQIQQSAAIGLVVMGTIVVVLTIVVTILLVLLVKKTRSQERV